MDVGIARARCRVKRPNPAANSSTESIRVSGCPTASMRTMSSESVRQPSLRYSRTGLDASSWFAKKRKMSSRGSITQFTSIHAP